MPMSLRQEGCVSPRAKINTFRKYLEMITALRKKEIPSPQGRRFEGYHLSSPLELFGSQRRQKNCAGISKYRCQYDHDEVKAGQAQAYTQRPDTQ